jgi:hypothetical protein
MVKASEAVSNMGPSNDYELAIARIVDQIDMDGRLSPSATEEVINKLEFEMNRFDMEFLVIYIQWRLDHPIEK